MLIRQFYQLKAIPVAGAAAYFVGSRSVGDEGIASTFGKIENGQLVSSPEQFHCWIECDGLFIDFMAPIFQENLQARGMTDVIIPRRIFQKPLTAMLPTIPDEFHEGGFHLVRSLERLEAMRESVTSQRGEDLLNLCLHWYRRPPAQMDVQFAVGSSEGETVFTLKGPDVDGFW